MALEMLSTGPAFAMAYRRLASILNRLQQFLDILKKYESTVNEQLQLKFIEEAKRTGGLKHTFRITVSSPTSSDKYSMPQHIPKDKC
jgi:hypothetical protein